MPFLPEKYHHDGEEDEMRQFSHEECGDTRSRLYVTRKSRGYLHHCHNCAPDMSGFTRTAGRRNPKQIMEVLAKREFHQSEDGCGVQWPRGYTRQLPDREKLWLGRWLTDKEIEDNAIGYDTRTGRIIFPILDGEGELIYYQARSLTDKPKYLNPRLSGKSVFFASGERNSNAVVLVEAIMSSIVVSRLPVYSIALLGAYIPREILAILRGYEDIYVWLDPDKKPEIIRAVRWLRNVTTSRVHHVFTEKKPKEYQDERLLREALQL